jgi:hypothetical protein
MTTAALLTLLGNPAAMAQTIGGGTSSVEPASPAVSSSLTLDARLIGGTRAGQEVFMDAQCFDQGSIHSRPAASARNRAAIGILNGFGRSLGDSMIGLQALTLAIAGGTVERDPTLLRLPGLPPITREL